MSQPAKTQRAAGNVTALLDIYRHMYTARQLDAMEEELVKRGEAFFMVSGAGHEGSAALNCFLTDEDWLHCHYRDKALMLARGIPAKMFIRSLLCKATSHSAGRQMSAHMSDPDRRVLTMAAPMGNASLQAVGVAAAVHKSPKKPLVLCSFGDGTTQEGEVFEAIGEAVRDQLPVLFLIHDNEYAISTTTTGKIFYSLPGQGPADSFYGIPIRYVDGWDVIDTYEVFKQVVAGMRQDRKPAIVVMKARRLCSHTNADDQKVYRSEEDIRASFEGFDPIQRLRAHLLDMEVSANLLDSMEQEIDRELREDAESALHEPDPDPTRDARRPLSPRQQDITREYRGDESEPRLTMLQALREVLRSRLSDDNRVFLYGEDIEDPKGDVFGVTKGLSTEFPGRVRNSPLAEATILGVSIGRALAGQRPVAFIQFADFLPIALNQIMCELGSIYWRTDGGWECPVIVMVSCGGYRAGLGPFHAHTFESVLAHTPGIDVIMPSTAADAAGLLNAAFESNRPTVVLYPKSLLNDRTQTCSPDVEKILVPLGKARVLRGGRDITLVGWGNTVPLCNRVAATLDGAGVSAEVIDLRTITPWDIETVVASAEKTGRLLVAHEDNLTCGMGAEVLAMVAERASRHIDMRRVTRPDTYVSFNFTNQLQTLPTFRTVLEQTVDLLDIELSWELPVEAEEGVYVVKAIGSSPADESVIVLEWKIKEGDEVNTGELIAEMEADKALYELTTPVSGIVREVMVPANQSVKVGTPLLRLETTTNQTRNNFELIDQPGTPIIRGRVKSGDERPAERKTPAPAAVAAKKTTVCLSPVTMTLGSRIVENDELLVDLGGIDSSEVISRTGIERRPWIGEGENAVSLAVDASRRLLGQIGLRAEELDLIVCSTGTPTCITPSMACQVLGELNGADKEITVQAYDINAACSGYLYAMQIAWDYLQSDPTAKILVVTTEVLSPLVDRKDFGTCILFGDGATATLVAAPESCPGAWAKLDRPVLSASGDRGGDLYVPGPNEGKFVRMNGRRVFTEAVKKMASSLEDAARQSGLAIEDLGLVVSHQANQRIIDALRRRLNVPEEKVFTNIVRYGNTSSNTIPVCLAEIMDSRPSGEKIGLCAFGGGFTFGAAILEKL